MSKDKKKIKWYKDVTFYADALTSLGAIGMLFAPHTAAYKVGAGVTIAVGLVSRWFGKKRQQYQRDDLPSGMQQKAMDIMPNLFTGVKGSKKGIPYEESDYSLPKFTRKEK